MRLAEKYPGMGGGIYPGFGNVSLDGGTSGAVFWFRVVGHIGGNDNEGGGNRHRIPPEYHM